MYLLIRVRVICATLERRVHRCQRAGTGVIVRQDGRVTCATEVRINCARLERIKNKQKIPRRLCFFCELKSSCLILIYTKFLKKAIWYENNFNLEYMFKLTVDFSLFNH